MDTMIETLTNPVCIGIMAPLGAAAYMLMKSKEEPAAKKLSDDWMDETPTGKKAGIKASKKKNKKKSRSRSKSKGNKPGNSKPAPSGGDQPDKVAAAPEEEAVEGEPALTKKQRKRLRKQKEAEEAAKAEAEAKKAERKRKKRQKAKLKQRQKEQGSDVAKPAAEVSPEQAFENDMNDGWSVVVGKPKKVKPEAKTAGKDEEKKDSKKAAKIAAPEYVEKLEVDAKFYGLIIGPKGSTLEKLRSGSGCQISVPGRDKEGNQKAGPVFIAGPSKEACKVAKDNLLDLVRKGFCKITDPEKSEGSIAVADRYHFLIIGPGGRNIRTIQGATGTRIVIPRQSGEGAAPGGERVRIVGTKKGIRTVKETIKSLVNYRWSEITHPGKVYAELEVPRDKHRLLVGSKGRTIRNIQGTTKTKVNIPSVDDTNQNVVVVGPPSAVQLAKAAIQKILAAPAKPAASSAPRGNAKSPASTEESSRNNNEIEYDEMDEYHYTS